MFIIEVPDEYLDLINNYGHAKSALLNHMQSLKKNNVELYQDLIYYFTIDTRMYSPYDIPDLLAQCLFDLSRVIHIQQRRNLLEENKE